MRNYANGNVSHGNRIGHSAQTAANQLQGYMREYRNEVCFTMDVSGFFMNIDRQRAYDIFVSYYNRYGATGYTDWQCNMLLNLLRVLLLHDPSQNCVRHSPAEMWKHIADNKTLFKSGGKGLPIGNFYSQLLANLVLANWSVAILALGFDLKISQFVDDSGGVGKLTNEQVMIVRKTSCDELGRMGLTLHPHKFYIQPVRHGMYFCGRWIYADRMYIGNRTVRACKRNIREASYKADYESALKLQRSFNSYIGFMCHCQSYNMQKMLVREALNAGLGKYLYFKKRHNRLICRMRKQYEPVTMIMEELNELLTYQKQLEYDFKKRWHKHRA